MTMIGPVGGIFFSRPMPPQNAVATSPTWVPEFVDHV